MLSEVGEVLAPLITRLRVKLLIVSLPLSQKKAYPLTQVQEIRRPFGHASQPNGHHIRAPVQGRYVDEFTSKSAPRSQFQVLLL